MCRFPITVGLSTFAPENLISRDGFGSPVPRQPAQFHTQAVSGAYLQDSSRVPRRRPFLYLKLPYAIGSSPEFIRSRNCVPMTFTAESPPVNLKVVSNECYLGRSSWTNQYLCASLSHTHYWYEVGMLKVGTCRVYRSP